MAIYDTIRLEKGMYAVPGKNFSQVLEDLDPSSNYEGGELASLDAYQRQLKRFDIRVSGTGSDMVEKFFQTSDSAALFPEYVTRAVRQGMEQADLLPSVVATVTHIDGMDYRTITSCPTEEDKSLKPVAEGAALPQTTVKTQENLVRLHKRGRMLVSSYEALRFQRLDLFTVTLRQIGAYIARAQLKDAVQVLIEGDGNQNPAGKIQAAASEFSYADLIKLWGALTPYELNTMLASTDTVQKLLNLNEMKDAQAGLTFQGTGKMISPLGARLLPVSCVEDGTILGLDNSCALEMVQAGDILTESDRLIDRQLERASISCIAGFAKIFPDACLTLSVK